MTRRILLVRHAMPQLLPGVDPASWVVGPEGISAAKRLGPQLAEVLRGGASVLASDEPKAGETARAATGAEPVMDPRFGEVRRPIEPFDAAGEVVRARRAAWVAGRLDSRHRGWETPGEAAVRFQAGVDARPVGDLVIATHGMVVAAWLVHIGHVAEGQAAERFWAALAFPDLVEVAW